jgi:mono/diheme cytochrome c family protein
VLRFLSLVVLLVSGASVVGADVEHVMAGVENPARARVNYMLNCQGCHGPTGAGMTDGTVPNMTGYVSRYLQVAGGREYLVQVPGSANAGITAAALAEVLNWMLVTMDATHLPPDFRPYTADEVELLRSKPLREVAATRAALLARMADL